MIGDGSKGGIEEEDAIEGAKSGICWDEILGDEIDRRGKGFDGSVNWPRTNDR